MTKAPEQPASPTLREALERLRRDSERASAGPWLYEADDEGWSMGWIGNMVPAGRGQVFNSLFAVEGDSAQQAINAEFAADCVNFVRDALSRPAEPAQGEVTEADVERVAFALERCFTSMPDRLANTQVMLDECAKGTLHDFCRDLARAAYRAMQAAGEG